ncbi:MAG TPA: hypothetical protein VF794_20775 [Archangium sp.]|jgi:hypothetical protein|uniref:hypothetical protein n=1 Tax=Archangium sp. TaxID=1872627 RepID=UPI002ED9FAC8
MKMLLVALQLTLTPPVPFPGGEVVVSTPPAENEQVRVIEFVDEPIVFEPPASEWDCFPDHRYGRWSRIIRIREDFDDKVMQSVGEM